MFAQASRIAHQHEGACMCDVLAMVVKMLFFSCSSSFVSCRQLVLCILPTINMTIPNHSGSFHLKKVIIVTFHYTTWPSLHIKPHKD